MNAADQFFARQEEPVKSCLVALRAIILDQDPGIKASWKYGMPFFCYREKMFCYLWIHKKYKKPYLGIVEGHRIQHPELLMEQRSRMKIMLFDPERDLPLDTIKEILQAALLFYKTVK
ncbi:hypothetical protein DBR32_01035 [Taibaiella sp. KBW10]|uniref:DUF1801 domain-containing protein n=1 Tax=Taibaiella sp. KBW10 TaxID=2153357 RepID=UPI000F5B240D|nr:DUF1801 domain-containing protein [Taibaiella sp. KBW10]RQO32227.1 hypothetical protein DBR32_01035 [Taibaiella sp. KBW10]